MSVRRVRATATLSILLTTLAVTLVPSPASAALPGYNLVISSADAIVPAQQPGTNYALCNTGKPLGGGFRTTSVSLRPVQSSVLSIAGWSVSGFNEGFVQERLTAVTICASTTLAYQVIAEISHVIEPGETISAQADCDSGRKPFGGGVTGTSNSLRVIDSYPLQVTSSNPNGGWAVTVANTGTSNATFTPQVVCDDKTHGNTAFVGTALTVPAKKTHAATPACPPNTRPVSGGYDMLSNDLRVQSSFPRPMGLGWSVTAYNPSKRSATFYAYALCVS